MNDKLVKLPVVLDMIQISRSNWYSMIANGKAPQPIKINRASFWSLSSIQELVEKIKAGEFE